MKKQLLCLYALTYWVNAYIKNNTHNMNYGRNNRNITAKHTLNMNDTYSIFFFELDLRNNGKRVEIRKLEDLNVEMNSLF